MSSARWIWAAVAAAALGAIGAGCQTLVVGGPNGSDCPATPPARGAACGVDGTVCSFQDGPCAMELICTAEIHEWGVQSSVCSPAAVDCWSAGQGDVCAVPGDSCGEDDGPCGSGFQNTCGADHHWQVGTAPGGDCCGDGELPCPMTAPNDGDPCEACVDQVGCTYDCGTTASCGMDSVWHVTIGDCPPPPPTDPCASLSADACAANAGCRWLVPSCVMPALPQAGCFDAADCTVDTCVPGLTCQYAWVAVDACDAGDCSACSAQAALCLP